MTLECTAAFARGVRASWATRAWWQMLLSRVSNSRLESWGGLAGSVRVFVVAWEKRKGRCDFAAGRGS